MYEPTLVHGKWGGKKEIKRNWKEEEKYKEGFFQYICLLNS